MSTGQVPSERSYTESLESFDGESAHWGIQQRIFSIVHQLDTQNMANPLLFSIEQLLFLYFACQSLFPDVIFPGSFGREVVVWTMSLALSVVALCLVLLLTCIWQFSKKNEVEKRIGSLFQALGTLYGSMLLFLLMVDSVTIEDRTLQMIFILSLISWLIIVAPLQILGLYPRKTISPSLDSRSENRIGVLFLIAKLVFFVMEISLSSQSNTSLYVGAQVLMLAVISAYVVIRMPYIHKGVNEFVLLISYLTSSLFMLRYIFCRFDIVPTLTNATVSVLLLTILLVPISYLTIHLRKRRIGFQVGIFEEFQRKIVPVQDMETPESSKEEKFGNQGSGHDEEDQTPIIEAYVDFLLRRSQKPYLVDIKMHSIWRECDADVVIKIFDALMSRVDKDSLDTWGAYLSLRHAEYILEYVESKKRESAKEYGRYQSWRDQDTFRSSQRLLFQVVKALQKCRFRSWDYRYRTSAVRERRIGLDQTNRSRQLILSKYIRQVEKLRGEGVLVLAEFWRHAAKGSSAEKLSQFVDTLYRIENKGRTIFKSLLTSFSGNPVALRCYAQFVEQIELNLEKAEQIRMNLDDEPGGGECVGVCNLSRMEGEQDDHLRRKKHSGAKAENVVAPPTPTISKNFMRVTVHSTSSEPTVVTRERLQGKNKTKGHPSLVETLDDDGKDIVHVDSACQYGSTKLSHRGLNGNFRETEEGAVSENNWNERESSCGKNAAGGSVFGGSVTSFSKQERQTINQQSPVCRRLHISIYVVLLAFLLVGLTLFFAIENFVEVQFEEDGDDPKKEGREKLFYRYMKVLDVGFLWHHVSFQSRNVEHALPSDGINKTEITQFETLQQKIEASFDSLTMAGTEIVSSAWKKSYPVKKNWPTSDFGADTHVEDYQYVELSAFDIYSDMMSTSGRLLKCFKGELTDQGICKDLIKYLVINGEYLWIDALNDVESAYQKNVQDSIDLIVILSICVFCSCIIVLLLVTAFVLVPVLSKIKRENKGVFQMFTLVPKEEKAKLYRVFSAEAGKQGVTGARRSGGKNSRDSLVGMPWRYATALFILGVAISLQLVLPLSFASDSRVVDVEIREIIDCNGMIYRSFFFLREMLANDSKYIPTYWTVDHQRESLARSTNELRQKWRGFLFGNDRHAAVAYRSPELLNLLYLDKDGMNVHVEKFLTEFDRFSRMDERDFSLNDPQFSELRVESVHFLNVISSFFDLYQEYYLERTDLYRSVNMILFIIGLPGLFFIYFVILRPSVRSINEQNRKMRSLFLLLPLSSLQQQQLIMDYIFSGEYSDDSEVVQSITSSERKKGRILQAAADGFIEINKNLSVTEYNMAAASIFGYEAEKVVGQNIRMLFDEASNSILVREVEACHRAFGDSSRRRQKEVEKREGRELRGVKENGSEFDVRVHLIAQQIENQVVVAAFLEDITFEKMQKKLLDEEKAKSNQLLLNILPHSIAERLKSGDELIADKHLDCSILFTDIVGFTRFSSDKEPEEVVRQLRALFTRFDEIVVKAKVMKIKTIGDAYMAVMGLDEEVSNDPYVVVEVALNMIEAAKECDFEIRAGIHVGKLTAGVVGVVKMTYDVWGNTVNVASRMESTSVPGHLQVSRAVYEHVYDRYSFRERKVTIKGFDEEQFVYLCLGMKDGQLQVK